MLESRLTINVSEKPDRDGRFDVSIGVGDNNEIKVAQKFHPFRAEEIQAVIDAAAATFPGINGEAEQIRTRLMQTAAPRRKKRSAPSSIEIPEADTEKRLAFESQHTTDLGNSARYVQQNRDKVRYCHDRGGWYFYTGKLWEWDRTGRAIALAKQTALNILKEAQKEEDDVRRAALIKHANASQKRDRINAMMALAQPELAITTDQLDAHPLLINTPVGTFDVVTGQLRPHQREDYITKICNASYDPAAPRQTFDKFTARIFRTRPALIDYIQKVAGYGGTGATVEQSVFFLWGRGANGKTTLIDALMFALGDYAAKADPELLMARDGGSAHPCNVADLIGRRMVVCSETNDGKRFDEGRLKDLAGETQLKARYLYRDFIQFTATHKIFIYSNHKPTVRGTDHGFWRRMRLIPFLETIGDDEKDANLLEKLKAEANGILTWIIDGAVRWHREGLGFPAEVADATKEYRTEMDCIGTFLTDECEEGAERKEYAADLYARYIRWCNENGEHSLSQKKLGTSLAERGFNSERCSYSGRKKWSGIGLKLRDPEEESGFVP